MPSMPNGTATPQADLKCNSFVVDYWVYGCLFLLFLDMLSPAIVTGVGACRFVSQN
jgi:hypothetical protein